MERTRVRIEYGDQILRRLAEEAEFRPQRWEPDVIRNYRRKIQFLGYAKDQRDLLSLSSMNLKKLKGGRVGQWSVRLNDQFQLVITFRTDRDDSRVVLVGLVDGG